MPINAMAIIKPEKTGVSCWGIFDEGTADGTGSVLGTTALGTTGRMNCFSVEYAY